MTIAERRTLPEPCFRVEVAGRELGQFAECSGIAVEYDVLEHREGGNNEFVHALRGHRRHTNVVLKRGLTDETALLAWFNDIEHKPAPALSITLLDARGQSFRTFTFAAAVPVRWTGPAGASRAPVTATESLEIAHQGLVP